MAKKNTRELGNAGFISQFALRKRIIYAHQILPAGSQLRMVLSAQRRSEGFYPPDPTTRVRQRDNTGQWPKEMKEFGEPAHEGRY